VTANIGGSDAAPTDSAHTQALALDLGIGVETKGATDPNETDSKDATDKDTPHDPPPAFTSDNQRRQLNKSMNRSKQLKDQRYYNKDGTYYKPDPQNAGVWNQYDKDGNHMGDVTTANLPDKHGPLGISDTLSDGYNNVQGKWCTQEQPGGFRALCAGTASPPGGVKGQK